MQIYSDQFGRVIWLTITPTQIRIDQQDLAPNFSYERSAVVSEVEKLCAVLKVKYDELQSTLLQILENKDTAFDLFTELLDQHHIHYDYFSG